MTRIPFEERFKIKPAEGDPYPVTVCSHPFCTDTDVERHHLVRRSFLGGAYDWIEHDGVKIGNVIGLCQLHHSEITDNRTMVHWNPLGYFEWVWLWEGGQTPRRLDPQPPIGTPDGSGAVYEPPDNPEICPTCKRPHKRQPRTLEKARPRKTWIVSIPVDSRENGAEVLDTLTEEARRVLASSGMAYSDDDKSRYFILSAALALFNLHAREVLS